jgi:hypothetical protein
MEIIQKSIEVMRYIVDSFIFVEIYPVIVAVGIATFIYAGEKIRAGFSAWIKINRRINILERPKHIVERRKKFANGFPLYLNSKLFYLIALMLFLIFVNTAGLPAILLSKNS